MPSHFWHHRHHHHHHHHLHHLHLHLIIIIIIIIFIIFIFTSSSSSSSSSSSPHHHHLHLHLHLHLIKSSKLTHIRMLGAPMGHKNRHFSLVLWKSHGQNLCEVKVDVVQWPNAVAPWRRGNVKIWYRHRNLTMQQICGIWLRHKNWPQKQKIWWWVRDGLGFRASGVPNQPNWWIFGWFVKWGIPKSP